MPRFNVTALSKTGEMINNRVVADSSDAAMKLVKDRGIVPIKVEIEKAGAVNVSNSASLFSRDRIGHRELLAFTRELAMLSKAGIALDRALDKLVELQSSANFRKNLRTLSTNVKSGKSLGSAMARTPAVFPPFYTGLVNAGEAGGTLHLVLEDIANIIQAKQELSEKISASLLYPLIVLIMIAASFIILMAWVVPEFRPLLESQGTNIPTSAAIVLFLSNLVVNWGWAIAVVLMIVILVAIRATKNEVYRRMIDRTALRIPVLGDIVRGFEAARYCRALGTLLSNGVTIMDAVGLAGDAVDNRVVSRALYAVSGGLARGLSLARVLRRADIIPPLVLEIIDVGEESGNLNDMLFLAADTAQSKAQITLQKLVVMIAPLVTVLLGAFVAGIIGTILSAILSTYDVPL